MTVGGGTKSRPTEPDHLERALDSAASETDAEALARELARATAVTNTPTTVFVSRALLLDLIRIAKRGVRNDQDADVLSDAQLIARTEGGRP